MNKKIKAVMMAGGFGTRIQPLTNSMPKPMLPIFNIPMMEHTLRKLVDIGITDIIILLYFKPEIIKNYFGDGSKIGANIEYILPDEDYGTAGAVGFARKHLDTTFIIVSGDLVSDFDFEKIINHHLSIESKLTITLTSVDNPLQFGVVIADEDGKIEKFLEKPSWSEVFSDTINTGIYVIEPEILNFIPKKRPFDFAKDLFPFLMKEGIDIMSYDARGYWRDVGNPESYREVYDDIFKNKLNFEIPGKKIEYPDGILYLTGESKVDSSVSIIDTVVIGDNVDIGKGVRLHNVVIGDNVKIGKDSRLHNSVLWNDIQIGKKVILDNSVICNNNNISDSVTAKAGLILAEKCNVGKFVNFEQDVIVWPNKDIEDSSIVNNNVVWESKYKNAIFSDGRVIGKANIEISCEMACELAEAFAAQLPVGSSIIVARDYSKSARMLKRAFLGGLLSGGIDVVDLQAMPPAVLRYNLNKNPDLVAGVYFMQNLEDPTSVEITLFNDEGLRIDTDLAKSVEKSFFQQKFRRVETHRLGEIKSKAVFNAKELLRYESALEEKIDFDVIKKNDLKVVIDLMFGGIKDIVPKIMSDLQIDNIILNSYIDSRRMANVASIEKKSIRDISNIVKSLNLNLGFLIYPNGQSLKIVTDEGEVLSSLKGLFTVLYLLNLSADKDNKKKVFLPLCSPDFLDYKFENLIIDRARYLNFKEKKMKNYDLICNTKGNFAFTEFALHRDAVYSSLKIMEILSSQNITLSEVVRDLDDFYFKEINLDCNQSQKGKVMKNALKDAKFKKSSTLDGVKIWESETDWVLMMPDQFDDFLHLFIQAKNKFRGEELRNKYIEKINLWISN
jgi:mannose-1-phosphate guanylyltransferase/phosphomannomutase